MRLGINDEMIVMKYILCVQRLPMHINLLDTKFEINGCYIQLIQDVCNILECFAASFFPVSKGAIVTATVLI